MKTWPIKDSDGCVFAFEIKVIGISIPRLGRFLDSFPNVSQVKVRRSFERSSDVHIEFLYHGREFMVWEPFGDNSRYWIGPKNDSEKKINIEELERAVESIPPTFFSRILGA